jgi:phospholipid/cholesterol/gamma-HCH transport system substrate-binding protein
MIKTAPTLPRLFAIVAFALSSFGALLFLWIAFGGSVPLKPKGYRFAVLFTEATQLSDQADVRIAGVSVGKVVQVEPRTGNRTRAVIEMRSRYAPVARDTRAILRLKTLLGETYVELTPGHRSKGVLAENGTLPRSAVAPTVELDEILRTFDSDTRKAFQTWMQSQAQAITGRGTDINAFFAEFPGFVEQFDNLFATLDAQQSAVRKTVASTGAFFDAISEREGELRGLVSDADRLFATTGARNRDLAQIFRELPRFERESTATLPALTAFGNVARPAVRKLQPAASEMGPTFAALQRLSPEFDGFFGQLSSVVDASKRGLPAFDRILDQIPPLLDDFQPFLRDANPMVRYIGDSKREVTAFFANTTAASLARDVNLERTKEPVHYLRTAQTLSPESLAFYPRPLGTSRQNAYAAPGAFDRLAAGLTSLEAATCANGDVAPPAAAEPDTLVALVQAFAFRTEGRDTARPPCVGQGPFPGFSTVFPQLRADP